MRTKIQGRVNAVLNKTTFSHTYGGVKVVCKCEGPKKFVYNGRSYTSLSAAGGAAAKDYGMKARFVNGWVFWKPERRSLPTEVAALSLAHKHRSLPKVVTTEKPAPEIVLSSMAVVLLEALEQWRRTHDARV